MSTTAGPARPSWWIPRRRGAYLDGASSAGARLLGIDAARGLAILGMMAAHVGVTTSGIDTLEGWLAFSHGRSSILFAVIGGFSLGLLSGGTRPHEGERLVRTRLRVLVRSGLLLVAAAILQIMGTDVAIILGYYAAWFALALPVLTWSARRLFLLAAATAIVGAAAIRYVPWLLSGLGMNPVNGFYSANGALVEFLFTGMYPGALWLAYVFLGLGLARIDWSSARRLVLLLGAGVGLAVAGHVGSYLLLGWLAPDQQPEWSLTELAETPGDPVYFEAAWEYGTATGPGWEPTPAPPWTELLHSFAHSDTAFEAIGSGGVALAIIAVFCLVALRARWLLAPLVAVGAMSLTLYCAHIAAIWAADPLLTGYATDNTTLAWMVGLSVAFAMAWRVLFARGPLEHVLHVISMRSIRAKDPALG